jgi:hypothetical protein
MFGFLCTVGIAVRYADADDSSDAARIARGFQIAPVPLTFDPSKRDLVGLGSYIVNAQGGCNDCHTNPPYAAGGNPYLGQPKKINAAGYLAGGTDFGPGPFGEIISRNITPDASGLPEGLTWPEFRSVIRTGMDPDAHRPLLVMPWPVYQDMRESDIRAIYEYLRAIPSK